MRSQSIVGPGRQSYQQEAHVSPFTCTRAAGISWPLFVGCTALFPSTSGAGLEPASSHRPGVGVLLARARITASGEPGPADQTAFHPINNEKV